MKTIRSYIIFILVFIISQPIIAQVEYFNKVFTINTASVAYGVIEKDSFYLTAGTVLDSVTNRSRVIINKFSHKGDLIWTKTWGDSNRTFVASFTNPFIETSDNGYALVGGIYDAANEWHSYLMKLNNNCDTVWMKHFYDTISSDPLHNFLALRNVKETYDKGFIIAGEVHGSQQYDGDVILIKLDSLGNTEWYKVYGEIDAIEQGYSVIQTPDTGYFIGGMRYKPGVAYSGDAYLIKTDKDGNKQWHMHAGGNYKDYWAVVDLAKDSNYIVAFSDGYEEIAVGYPSKEISVFKITSNWQVLWSKKFRGQVDHFVNSVHVIDDGNIIVGGYSWEASGYGGFIMKISDNGDSLWYRDVYNNQQITYNDDHTISDVIPTCDGGYIACGEYKNSLIQFPQSTWLVKVDSMGCDTPGCFTVGVKDPKEIWNTNLVSVYPNPAYNYLNIEINQPFNGSLHFELFDSYGRLVKQYKITNPLFRIFLEKFSDGMYFYRVKRRDKMIDKGKVLVVK